MYVPKWLLFIFGCMLLTPYLLGIMAWTAWKYLPRISWTREDKDKVLAALIEEKARERRLERMRESWYDASSNTRGEAN